jgi:pyruvate/oxaloacetate carboxyltransferase
MEIRKDVGRPTKMTIRRMDRIADAIKNNCGVADACVWGGVSKDTYYRYMNNNVVFSNTMKNAIKSRNTVSFNFRTAP